MTSTDRARPPAFAEHGVRTEGLRTAVGLAAIGFSALYVVADVVELLQGGFSVVRLAMTYAAEAAIPLFVLGIYGLQRPRIGRLGFFGAVTYAYSYVFFTSTVVYALVADVPDYQAVTDAFGSWMTAHGAIMVVGGLAFGLAIVRARELPRWTGVCLMAGVVLVAAASGLPTLARAVAEVFPAAAFTGMGLALLTGRPAR